MPAPVSTHLTRHEGSVTPADRARLLGHRGCVIWLTGLSGSGKSTVAHALAERLVREGRLAYVLDGDTIRHGLNSDLGFGEADRNENIRRIGAVAALFADAGVIAITAFISPYRRDRDLARAAAGVHPFLEVFVDAPVEICEERDPKGLYRKARTGEIAEFTGVSAPYEAPLSPELRIPTADVPVAGAVDAIVRMLEQKNILASPPREAAPR